MYKAFAALLVGIVFLADHTDSCKQGYSTTIILQDPKGDPIENAKIEMTLLCGSRGTILAQTNAQAEAFFSYSSNDLGRIKITLAGFGVEALEGAVCSGPDKAKRCVVRFGT